jgi:N-acetylated-alpha-linked acidic dipeptidase
MAQTAGTAVMRLADADLLPFNFTNFADTLHTYVDSLQKLLKQKQEEIRERNREIEEGVFTATADPKKIDIPPAKEEVPPYLNFAALENGVDAVTRSAGRYQKALVTAEANGAASLGSASLEPVNRTLLQSERALLSPEGLPGRPWFKHQIAAPGFYTGYDVKTIPAVREAIEQGKWREADVALAEVGRILNSEAAMITTAAEQLEGSIR